MKEKPAVITSFKTVYRATGRKRRWIVTDKYGGASLGQGVEDTQLKAANAARICKEQLIAKNPNWKRVSFHKSKKQK